MSPDEREPRPGLRDEHGHEWDGGELMGGKAQVCRRCCRGDWSPRATEPCKPGRLRSMKSMYPHEPREEAAQ
ncbi:MAG: hypothetical protein AAFP22_15730 [Planctomycetota bacterium]